MLQYFSRVTFNFTLQKVEQKDMDIYSLIQIISDFLKYNSEHIITQTDRQSEQGKC